MVTAHPLLDTLGDMNGDNPVSYLGKDECHRFLLKAAWAHCQDDWDVAPGTDENSKRKVCRSEAEGQS